MKRIAIPVVNNTLSAHFGHAPHFFIYDTEDTNIIKQAMEQSPAHTPGAIPRFLKELGVTDVIVSGIGQKAIEIFNSAGINVFSGAQPAEPEVIVNDFLNDRLTLNANTCDSEHHGHDHSHHGHHH